MTPSERAHLVLKETGGCCLPEFHDACEYEPCSCRADMAAVADHIRRAENDALERVASWLDKTRYSSALAKDVRAMKHEVAN